jgi:hypothetical protein
MVGVWRFGSNLIARSPQDDVYKAKRDRKIVAGDLATRSPQDDVYKEKRDRKIVAGDLATRSPQDDNYKAKRDHVYSKYEGLGLTE